MPLTTERAGTLLVEALAPKIEIEWRRGDSGRVVWHFIEEVFLEGALIHSAPSRSVAMPLEELLQQSVRIQIAPGVFEDLPVAKVMLAFKAMTEVAYDLPPPAAFPAPAPLEAPDGPA